MKRRDRRHRRQCQERPSWSAPRLRGRPVGTGIGARLPKPKPFFSFAGELMFIYDKLWMLSDERFDILLRRQNRVLQLICWQFLSGDKVESGLQC